MTASRGLFPNDQVQWQSYVWTSQPQGPSLRSTSVPFSNAFEPLADEDLAVRTVNEATLRGQEIRRPRHRAVGLEGSSLEVRPPQRPSLKVG